MIREGWHRSILPAAAIDEHLMLPPGKFAPCILMYLLIKKLFK
jgi:hypothetical protein